VALIPHGLFLDITGCAHRSGGEAALMQIVCGALTRHGFLPSAPALPAPRSARTMTRHVPGKSWLMAGRLEAVAAAGVRARRR
jgi:protein ImuB